MACRKRAYPTKKDACTARNHLMRTGANALLVYRCQHCQAWHLTSHERGMPLRHKHRRPHRRPHQCRQRHHHSPRCQCMKCC